jgi:mannose-6-phosphate isomerase-like protein (cupin superfamily)
MEIREFRGHPLFGFRGQSRYIQTCWKFQLKHGENTRHRLQSRSEVIFVILAGSGRMTVGGTTSVVEGGEVIFVPPGVPHYLENPAGELLRGISIEAEPAPEPSTAASGDGGEEATPAAREHPRRLDEVVESLPAGIGEADAIQAIVRLFDIGGALSEQIEAALGLDNDVGSEALRQLERKLMAQVVEIADRYRFRDRDAPGHPRWS